MDNPAAFIQKMITFARPGGYVVCIDANREFECCGLYIDGMDYQELCRHDGLEKSGGLNSQCRGGIMQLLSGLHI